MTVTKLRGLAQEYFERIVGHTIIEVAIFDGELVFVLDDGGEVCVFEDERGLCMQVNEPVSEEDKEKLN